MDKHACIHIVCCILVKMFTITIICIYKSLIYTQLNNMYKIGLLYCKNGQSLEEEMYNNGMCMFICTCVCIHYVCVYAYVHACSIYILCICVLVVHIYLYICEFICIHTYVSYMIITLLHSQYYCTVTNTIISVPCNDLLQ